MEYSAEEQKFLELFESNKSVYEAWGDYVVKEICGAVEKNLSDRNLPLSCFFKIPPKYRLKDAESLVKKAYHRNKPYKDPWNDITDKVGCRFVVLLLSDIEIVEKAISEKKDIWTFSHDRDFKKEINENPEKFAYQSQHYILRNIESLQLNGVEIPRDTPCEVQIRTLMQHAYSEITHDTIYKSDFKRKNEIVRLMSRCSALIESTDEIFEQANKSLNGLNEKFHFLYDCTKAFVKTNNLKCFEKKDDLKISRKLIDLWDDEKIKEYKDFLDQVAFDYANEDKNPLIVNLSDLQILFFILRYKRLFEDNLDELELKESDYLNAYIAAGLSIPNF